MRRSPKLSNVTAEALRGPHRKAGRSDNQHQVVPSVLLYYLFFLFQHWCKPLQPNVTFSVAKLRGGLNVWSRSELWSRECFQRWLLISSLESLVSEPVFLITVHHWCAHNVF